VIDQVMQWPRGGVVVARIVRGQRVERLLDGYGIYGGSSAGLGYRSAATAAEIDAEPLEYRGGAGIRRDDLAYRGVLECLVHDGLLTGPA
jgi:hypothetical protein